MWNDNSYSHYVIISGQKQIVTLQAVWKQRQDNSMQQLVASSCSFLLCCEMDQELSPHHHPDGWLIVRGAQHTANN